MKSISVYRIKPNPTGKGVQLEVRVNSRHLGENFWGLTILYGTIQSEFYK